MCYRRSRALPAHRAFILIVKLEMRAEYFITHLLQFMGALPDFIVTTYLYVAVNKL